MCRKLKRRLTHALTRWLVKEKGTNENGACFVNIFFTITKAEHPLLDAWLYGSWLAVVDDLA